MKFSDVSEYFNIHGFQIEKDPAFTVRRWLVFKNKNEKTPIRFIPTVDEMYAELTSLGAEGFIKKYTAEGRTTGPIVKKSAPAVTDLRIQKSNPGVITTDKYLRTLERAKAISDKAQAKLDLAKAKADAILAKIQDKEDKAKEKEKKKIKKQQRTKPARTAMAELEAKHVDLVLQRMAIGIDPKVKAKLTAELKALRLEIEAGGGDHRIGNVKTGAHLSKEEMNEAAKFGEAKKVEKKKKKEEKKRGGKTIKAAKE